MNAVTGTDETMAAPAGPSHAVRPFYWSLRRELWESRSLIIAPLVASGVIVVALLLALTVNAGRLSTSVAHLAALSAARQQAVVSGAYFGIGMLVVWVAYVSAFFYSLDALHSERRDRSILFWKSMPVSDLTTVISKLFTALVVTPVIAFACILGAQLAVLLIVSVVLAINGVGIAPIWSNLQLLELMVATLYLLVVLSLWYAPVAAWLLFVSAWARRSTFLWAVLPPAVIVLFERIAFGTQHLRGLLEYRLQDGVKEAFTHGGFLVEGGGVSAEIDLDAGHSGHVIQLLDPGAFFGNPYLWAGLVVAGALVAATIWLRRYREPI